MIIYKVLINNSITEFKNISEAEAFALQNNISFNSIEQEERELVVQNIPESVTPRQIRQALALRGVSTADIDNALNSLPEPIQTLAKIEWEYSTEFQRSRDFVKAVQQVLQWTDEQVDDLWILADSL
jgi:hypothetical protein